MSDNAWNLLTKAGVPPEDVEALCVVVDGEFTEILPTDAQAVLEAIEIYTSFGDPDWIGQPTNVRGEGIGFQAWTRDSIYRTRLDDGIVKLDRIARTVGVLTEKPMPTYDAEAIAQLAEIMPIRRRPHGFETIETVPMSPEEWSDYKEQQRRQFTIGLAGDIEYIMQDVAMIAEQSEGLPVAHALQVLHEALAVALVAVQAQVEVEKS